MRDNCNARLKHSGSIVDEIKGRYGMRSNVSALSCLSIVNVSVVLFRSQFLLAISRFRNTRA
jgi:hypothetical protein